VYICARTTSLLDIRKIISIQQYVHNDVHTCSEHILFIENTFWDRLLRTHSISREHILFIENTFHLELRLTFESFQAWIWDCGCPLFFFFGVPLHIKCVLYTNNVSTTGPVLAVRAPRVYTAYHITCSLHIKCVLYKYKVFSHHLRARFIQLSQVPESQLGKKSHNSILKSQQ